MNLRVNLKDSRLKLIDNLLDNPIINRLLPYEGVTPLMKKLIPNAFLRAELLKATRYPEITHREYCTDEYLGLD